jgi:hypothetical protein
MPFVDNHIMHLFRPVLADPQVLLVKGGNNIP